MTADDDRRFHQLANDADPDLAEMLELIWDRIGAIETTVRSVRTGLIEGADLVIDPIPLGMDPD